MSTREISDKMSSGELTSIKVGGIAAGKEVALQEGLDLKLNKDVASFTPQTVYPAHAEGKTFYDDVQKGLTVYTDIVGPRQDLGRELWMRVINLTGVTIEDGQACRHDGSDITTGHPKVQLAIATSIQASRVLGVATHDILDGEEGWITTFGVVHGIDTSLYTAGFPMYLSDTIAGGYTSTPPILATQVGGVLVSDADGVAFVSIINHISLPSLIGILKTTGATPFIVDTTPLEVKPFTTEHSLGITVDKTTGRFTIPNTGWYSFSSNVTIAMTPSTPAIDHILSLNLYNTTAAEIAIDTTLTIADATPTGSRSVSDLFYATAGDSMAFRVSQTTTTRTITFTNISLNIESKRIVA